MVPTLLARFARLLKAIRVTQRPHCRVRGYSCSKRSSHVGQYRAERRKRSCERWAGKPGIDPETIKAVHLSTWYFFDMTYNVTNVQLLGCGLFAILDRSEHRIFPAWLGWLCLFTAASFFLETIMPYFNHGPLAINGWWNFWFGFVIWFLWFSTQSLFVLREARRSARGPSPTMTMGRKIRGVYEAG